MLSSPSRSDLFWGPAKIGRATVSYDRDSRLYSVWAPGHSARTTRSYTKALDLATGLA